MKRGTIFVLGLFVFVTLLFFNPILKGHIPFPGDLLISEYTPYSSYPYREYAPGAYPNKAQNFDVIRLIYPAKLFSIETLKNGHIPLWNPHIFSGNPHIASLQSGTFYPLNIVFLLPFPVAWTLFIVVQPILAAFFTYLFLKEIKLTRTAAIFGSIAFAFSSFSIVWMEYGNLNHSYLWLPLLLYLGIGIIKSPSVVKYSLFIFALVSSIFAGYIQFAMYVYAFSFAFIVFFLVTTVKEGRRRKLLAFVGLYVVSILIASIQLFPMIELFQQSTRSPYSTQDFLKLLIPSFHFLTFLVPDFFGNPASRNYWPTGTYIERVSYIGIIPAFFAFYSLLLKTNKMVWFFGASSAILLLVVFDTFISRSIYSLYIPPILSTAVPSRIMFLFCFSASILAAIGFNSFINKYSFKKAFFLGIVLMGIITSLWGAVYLGAFTVLSTVEASAIAKRNLLLPTGIIGLLIGGLVLFHFLKRTRGIIIAGLIALTIFELFYFFRKITPFAPVDTLYPQTPVMEKVREIQGNDRVWGYGSGHISTNLQTVEGIYGVEGYDALHLKRYGELLVTSEKNQKDPPRSEAELLNGYGTSDVKDNKNRQRLMDILGIKYVLHKSTNGATSDTLTFPEGDYSLVWSDSVWQIYENLKSVPRVYFASTIYVETRKDAILSHLLSDSFNPSNSVVLEEGVSLQTLPQTGTVKITSYTPNKIEISVNTQRESMVVLTDNYYSGWEAAIDGNETKIYRANYTFRAIKVPEGKHEITFSYEPKSFQYGMLISALTLGSVILYFIYLTRKK